MADTLDFHHLLAEAAERLEPLPAAAVQLASIIADPDTGPDEITEVLSTDPALAAHVLREANSAFSASQTPVGSLEQAVVRIGAARVLEVTIRGQLGDRLQTQLDLYDLGGAERRKLAVGAASAAAIISVMSPKTISRDVVCASLLHGIGMDVIDAVAEPAAADSLRQAGVSIHEMEHELVSADHAEVGGFVLRRWGLPATLVDAVEHQLNPELGLEAAVVCLATDIASDELFGEDLDPDPTAVAAVVTLGLEERIDDVRARVHKALEDEGLLDDD
ncbi:MAG: HDOD domain-containing protein [Actinomycetota bacterium]